MPNPEIKIPTWFGIEVKAGLENNLGENKNTELTTGKSSTWGISTAGKKSVWWTSDVQFFSRPRVFNDQSQSGTFALLSTICCWMLIQLTWDGSGTDEVFKVLNEATAVNP